MSGSFNCPACSHYGSKVYNTRTRDNGNSVWRRRRCHECGHRWSTWETKIAPHVSQEDLTDWQRLTKDQRRILATTIHHFANSNRKVIKVNFRGVVK